MKREHWRNKLSFGRSDLVTLLLSVVTGMMIWVYVDSRRTEERTVTARLEVVVPVGWRLDGQPPETVLVSLRGPRTVMGTLKPEEVRFRRELEPPPGATSNQEIHFQLTRDDLRGLPRDVTVTGIPEATIKLRLVRPVRRFVPVEVQTKGEMAKGFTIKNITFSPEYVAVYAAAEEFSGADAAKTLPVNLTEKTASFGTYVDLEPLKLKHKNLVLEDPVFVQVEVVEKIAQQHLEKVPVGILLATPMEKLVGGKLIPSQVTVVVEGGEQAVASLAANAISVYIDTKEMGSSVQGEYTLRCRTIAPAGIKVLSVDPEEVRWVIPGSAPAPTAPASPTASAPAILAVPVVKVSAGVKSTPAKTVPLPSAEELPVVPTASGTAARSIPPKTDGAKVPPVGTAAPLIPAGAAKPAGSGK